VSQCLFEGVCMPQYFHTLPGFDQDWTQCLTLDASVMGQRTSVKKVGTL